MISQKELKDLVEYDPDSGIFTWKVSRFGVTKGKVAGCNDKRYRRLMLNGIGYSEHRLAWLYVYGYIPEMIDHIDGNSFNNKLSNLREVTKIQNSWNRTVESHGKSKIKNVNWCNTKKRWLVKIQYLKKRIYIGSFVSLELAELVAEEARLKYYGEFARSY